MKIFHIHFSPTGGTKKAGEYLLQPWEKKVEEINLLDGDKDFSAITFCNDDICYVSVPSFGGRVPAVATKRLEQMEGHGAKTVAVCVYGNRAYEDTLLELTDTLTARGFSCAAGAAAIAEHSIMHQFAAGRPDEEDKKELLEFGREIRKKIEQCQEYGELHIPGNRPYKKLGVSSMIPQTGDECVNCKICARECPVAAIDLEKPEKTNADKCIACMHCIAVCPEHARKLDSEAVAALTERLKDACQGRKQNELFL